MLIIGAGYQGWRGLPRPREEPRADLHRAGTPERIGGTWDLFRYPGIRSDSDIFTLSFPYQPWTEPENVADGADIRDYLTETAREHGIDRHIRFNTHVLVGGLGFGHRHLDRSGRTGRSGRHGYRARFLFFGTGYYNYDEPYTPEFPGLENFGGDVVHPQFWPESLDYSGKRVVVIGSGATAVSLIARADATGRPRDDAAAAHRPTWWRRPR